MKRRRWGDPRDRPSEPSEPSEPSDEEPVGFDSWRTGRPWWPSIIKPDLTNRYGWKRAWAYAGAYWAGVTGYAKFKWRLWRAGRS